jgi:retron-type reverse transcriptase
MEFKWLMNHFSRENLISCFNELDGKKATGIDRLTKESYAQEVVTNIDSLINRMKKFSYRPQPVREVLIPKGDGKFRPLGISTIEDKIIQSMYCKILESIYDPIFCHCSYGFRRNRSTHMAIVEAIDYLKFNNVKMVIDVDLENFFWHNKT